MSYENFIMRFLNETKLSQKMFELIDFFIFDDEWWLNGVLKGKISF